VSLLLRLLPSLYGLFPVSFVELYLFFQQGEKTLNFRSYRPVLRGIVLITLVLLGLVLERVH